MERFFRKIRSIFIFKSRFKQSADNIIHEYEGFEFALIPLIFVFCIENARRNQYNKKGTKIMKLSLVESRIFGKICYGYRRDKQGLVEIVPEEAEVVRTVFGLYTVGNSLEDIQGYLFTQGIPSPSGKAQWSRDVLNKLLNNGKYTKGIIKFEDYCFVYFLKGENCRNTNQAKVVNTNAKSNQRRTGMGICPNQREVSGACE